MKKFILTALIFTGSILAVQAQETQPKDDNTEAPKRIEALYVAYITKELNLTTDEAQKFWPVHTQFTNEIKAVKPDLPELEKQQAVLNIKKKYQDNFNRILGNNRCERFFRLDGEFKRKLLEKIRKQRQEQRRPALRRGL
jgi:hypothetical protein